MADNFNILDQSLGPLTTNALASGESSMPREVATNVSITQTSQSLRLCYFTALKSETITSVRLTSTGTAAGATPSLVRVGIWTADSAGALVALVASTANDTALLAVANTDYLKALSASWSKVAGQRYAVGVLVVTAATAPTISGGGLSSTGIVGRAPRISGLVGGQSDLPSSVASGSITESGNRPYVEFVP